jgi:hypothetical protein
MNDGNITAQSCLAGARRSSVSVRAVAQLDQGQKSCERRNAAATKRVHGDGIKASIERGTTSSLSTKIMSLGPYEAVQFAHMLAKHFLRPYKIKVAE